MFRTSNLTVDYDSNNHYDLAIVGSDQVWGGNEKECWGEGINADYLTTYAPSVGNLVYSSIAWKSFLKGFYGSFKFYKKKKSLQQFDKISVRDKQTKILVKNTLKMDVPIVLDPTFLIDWNSISDKRLIQEDYIVIYSYNMFSGDIDDVLIAYAKKNNFKIVAINFETEKYDYNAPYSPQEVLSLFKYASMVFTNTFHGTVFSIIFERQFMVPILSGKKDKTYMLLEQLNLKSRAIFKSNDIINEVNNVIDYTNVKVVIDKYLKISKDYLNDCFNLNS